MEPESDRLDSWKEIAAHFRRDIRTVRRWEEEQGLPVHRHMHQRLASVYAFKSELDAWWANGKPASELASPATAESPGPVAPPTEVARKRPVAVIVVSAIVAGAVVLGVTRWFRATSGSSEIVTTRLTYNAAERPVNTAAISPDGKYLAIADPAGLAIQTISTGEVRRLPDLPDVVAEDLAWLPDSTSFLIGGAAGIWRTSIFGDRAVKISTRQGAVAVSPGGRRLAMDDRVTREIIVMTMLGDNVLVVATPTENWIGFSRPTWSPDSGRVAFGTKWKSDKGPYWSIDTCAVASLACARAISPVGLASLIWLADGRLIYSDPGTGERLRSAELWSLRVDQAGAVHDPPVRLLHTPDLNFLKPSATADGTRLVFTATEHQADIYVAAVDPAHHALSDWTKLIISEHQNRPAAWSLDANSLLVQSEQRGRNVIVRQPLVGGGPENLPVVSQNWTQDAVFTTDGDHLLATAMTKSLAGSLKVISLADGASTTLTDFESVSVALKCAAVKAGLCFLSEPLRERMRVTPIDRHDPRALPPIEIPLPRHPEAWDVSPDAKTIALLEAPNDSSGLLLVDRSTGSIRRISSPAVSGATFIAWSVDGSGWLLTRKAGRQGTEVIWLFPDGGTKTLWSGEHQILSRPRFSPDGKRLAFASYIVESRAWMLRGF